MKRRTIGILTLCAVLALLVLNWQTQPFHRLQDRNVVPLSVGIVRSDARGSKTVNLQGSQAVQALQACARRTVPLWVGPTEKAYAPEDGSVYHVTVAGVCFFPGPNTVKEVPQHGKSRCTGEDHPEMQ